MLESDRNAFNKKYDNKLKRVGEMEDTFEENTHAKYKDKNIIKYDSGDE